MRPSPGGFTTSFLFYRRLSPFVWHPDRIWYDSWCRINDPWKKVIFELLKKSFQKTPSCRAATLCKFYIAFIQPITDRVSEREEKIRKNSHTWLHPRNNITCCYSSGGGGLIMDKLLLCTCPRTVGSAVATVSKNFSFAVIQIEDLVLFYIIRPTLEYVMHIRTGRIEVSSCTLSILKSRKIKQKSIERKLFYCILPVIIFMRKRFRIIWYLVFFALSWETRRCRGITIAPFKNAFTLRRARPRFGEESSGVIRRNRKKNYLLSQVGSCVDSVYGCYFIGLHYFIADAGNGKYVGFL